MRHQQVSGNLPSHSSVVCRVMPHHQIQRISGCGPVRDVRGTLYSIHPMQVYASECQLIFGVQTEYKAEESRAESPQIIENKWSGRRGSNPRRPAWELDIKLQIKKIASLALIPSLVKAPFFSICFETPRNWSTSGVQRSDSLAGVLVLL